MFHLIIPMARLAFLTVLVPCSDHERFADRVIPKYFAHENCS